MRKHRWLLILFVLVACIAVPLIWKKKGTPDMKAKIEHYQMRMGSLCLKVVQDSNLYTEGWDTLVQPNFWRAAMKMPPDSIIVNIAKTRQIIEYKDLGEWRAKSERVQKAYEDSIRSRYGLDKKDEIYFTTGRNHFYRFHEMLRPIDRAIEVFEQEQTDPWYAQAILLIESPGRLQYSTSGAYGAFQLMEAVAREVGLVVNDTLDEREDFEKAAMGAARLIKRVCLPKARELCDKFNLPYEEDDLWFRLLTMHIYHAGIGNVRRVVNRIKPKQGGIPFITDLWQTKGRRFGNASQNYSQIILACLLELEKLLEVEGIICPQEEINKPKPGILPDINNPRYWSYHGEPVLLLGGSKDDNLFQVPKLSRHLDSLKNAGVNYVRNTMSSRPDGGFELWPFARQAEGRYNLDQWEEGYWARLERLLEHSQKREIIVQIEIWAMHDFFLAWEESPWNPHNNVNYDTIRTQLKSHYDGPATSPHDFFFSVPNLQNDSLLLNYQQKYVDRLLAHTLAYDNVLYTVSNELHKPFSPEWGWYWAQYIREKAKEAARPVQVSEMYWYTDLKHARHLSALDHPEHFSFFEASQNSAKSGQENWDNLQYVWHYVSDSPRPINHTKIYGANSAPKWAGKQDEAIARFWRNLLGGSASSRFHRPPSGLGFSKVARSQIAVAREVEQYVKFWDLEPRNDLLSAREPNEAYLAAWPGNAYLLYFPASGAVKLKMEGRTKSYQVVWINLQSGKETHVGRLDESQEFIRPPGRNGYLAVIYRP